MCAQHQQQVPISALSPLPWHCNSSARWRGGGSHFLWHGRYAQRFLHFLNTPCLSINQTKNQTTHSIVTGLFGCKHLPAIADLCGSGLQVKCSAGQHLTMLTATANVTTSTRLAARQAPEDNVSQHVMECMRWPAWPMTWLSRNTSVAVSFQGLIFPAWKSQSPGIMGISKWTLFVCTVSIAGHLVPEVHDWSCNQAEATASSPMLVRPSHVHACR